MRTASVKSLRAISLLYTLVTILHLFLVIKLLLNEQILAFILLIIIIVADKLVLVYNVWIKTINENNCEKLQLFIQQICVIINPKDPQKLEYSYYHNRLFLHLLPWSLIQSIILFHNSSLIGEAIQDNSFNIIIYISFLIQLIVASIMLQQINQIQEGLSSYTDEILLVLSSYLLNTALFSIQDSNNMYLGVYSSIAQIIIFVVQIAIIPFITSSTRIIQSLQCTVFQIPYEWINQKSLEQHNSNILSNYLNQIIKITILFIGGIPSIRGKIDNFQECSIKDQLISINFIISILAGIAHLKYQFNVVKESIVHQKVLVLNNYEDIVKADLFLQSSFEKILKLQIYFLNDKNVSTRKQILQNNKILPNKLMRSQCNPDYCIMYSSIIYQISKLQQRKVEIDTFHFPEMCQHHFFNLLKRLEFLPPSLLSMFKKHIMIYSSQQRFDLLVERYFNGYGFNDNQISKYLYNQLPQSQMMKLLILESQLLQIFVFNKYVNHEMYMNPSLIMYDLIQLFSIKAIKKSNKQKLQFNDDIDIYLVETYKVYNQQSQQ